MYVRDLYEKSSVSNGEDRRGGTETFCRCRVRCVYKMTHNYRGFVP